ncbi:hypothetical protein, partial [Hymenobacter sp.]|uniref:hypothetical protein n=1 Tax=Hymenobacter sp. TaxID=1898978 RepID=UPI002EDA819A
PPKLQLGASLNVVVVEMARRLETTMFNDNVQRRTKLELGVTFAHASPRLDALPTGTAASAAAG